MLTKLTLPTPTVMIYTPYHVFLGRKKEFKNFPKNPTKINGGIKSNIAEALTTPQGSSCPIVASAEAAAGNVCLVAVRDKAIINSFQIKIKVKT